MSESPAFPFSAIVDQADMKDALLCNAVHPAIGGVLISGTRGTAKSTAARSLAHLLPPIRAVGDCPFNCPPTDPAHQCERCMSRGADDLADHVVEKPTPFVTLPIGATEDRVLGTFELEAAIQEGERSFDPGLLARANRGILYVDEVNLLRDHLVDVLLDAVATGTNRVEREGLSVEHPANVMLVGTMNPEEGELRPQLLDRFGLYVDMDESLAADDRKSVVRRRTRFDADPEEMAAEWQEEEATLAERIRTARGSLPDVHLDEEQLDLIVNLCVDHDVEGLRADIIIHRTARALAALDGIDRVEKSHVTRAAELALGHRTRTGSDGDPRGPDPSDTSETERDPPDRPPHEELSAVDQSSGDQRSGESGSEEGESRDGEQASAGTTEDRVFPIVPGKEPPRPAPDRRINLPEPTRHGGRTQVMSTGRHGAYTRARRPTGRPTDIALDASIRAAAPHQVGREARSGSELAVQLHPADLREKQRQTRVTNLVVFVVDASGSMGAYQQMSAVKGAVLSLLAEAYQQRDYVSLVGFRGDRADTLLSPTSSVQRAARELADLPTGGRTPLAAGLERGLLIVERARRIHAPLDPLIVLVSDGRSNYPTTGETPVRDAFDRAGRIATADVSALCLDTETGPVQLGIVRTLADLMGAEYYRFDELDEGDIAASVKAVFSGAHSVGA